MKSVPIYHITHICNLKSIIEKGGLLSDSEMKKQQINFQEIAYQNLKGRRAKTPVPISSQGMLADYVPFYFTNRSPMLGAIYISKVEDYRGGQKEVLHLVSSIERVVKEECEW